ncbi:hypothetical protein [Allorhizobium borbori]|uniref:Uncharacterized protein n=1 Tax=Allorhizobium borbori TaxID=485907 RepID=A0A7W6K0N1_9HYPH|nr:hypothetical protein [Allorhizobium borbori]MBB4103004.1 hypothetical protein [Allorhizobium borbori]
MIRVSGGAVMALAAVALIAAVIFLVDWRATKRALDDVRARDNAAAENADDARGRFDACPVGMWDFGAGQCRSAAADRRD